MIEFRPISERGLEELKKGYCEEALKGLAPALRSDAASRDAIRLHILESVANALESSHDYLYDVVETANRMGVGAVWYRLHRDGWFSDTAMIVWLSIAPERRRQGFATATLRELQRSLKEQGISRLTLEVFSSNKGARKLYRSLGFQEQRSVLDLTLG